MASEPVGLRPQPARASLAEAAEMLGLPTAGTNARIDGITLDSRRVGAGDLYVGLPGSRAHGAAFWPEAVGRGASAMLTDSAGSVLAGECGLPMLVAEDPRGLLGRLSAWIYGEPGERLTVIGVTGTNGKTTTATLVEAAVRQCGAKVGVIGTTGVRVDGECLPSARTTPEAPDLHALLAVMVERGVEAVAMEVTSHALIMGRVDALSFDCSIFTNLGRDHLDFHRDQASYFGAKEGLFRVGRSRRAIVNADDSFGRQLLAKVEIPAQSYSLDAGSGADWSAAQIVPDGLGFSYRLVGPNVDLPTRIRIPGRFNVSNAVAAGAAAMTCGYDPACVLAGIAASRGAVGRMELVDVGGDFSAIVDYAHTPDAVAEALRAGRDLVDPGRGRLLVVLGAGGNRDQAKRPEMGRAAAMLADIVIVTDDNPRTEDPKAIRAQVVAGARSSGARIVEVEGRPAAIAMAVAEAKPGDVVMVLGKGHETGQEIGEVIYPMDDRALVEAAGRDRSV